MALRKQILFKLIQANNVSMPGEPIETNDGKQLTTRIVSTFTIGMMKFKDFTVAVNPLER